MEAGGGQYTRPSHTAAEATEATGSAEAEAEPPADEASEDAAS